jgi:hypothetical protein
MTALNGVRGKQLLCRLAASGISLTLTRRGEEDKLVAKPTALVSPEILEELRANKATLIEALSIASDSDRDSEPEPPPFIQRQLNRASELGLVAKWSRTFGYVSLHDPVDGSWHDIPTKDAEGWMLWEASKRKELWRSGDRRAFELTAREMQELWERDHPSSEPGIVEETPLPDD